MTRRYRAHEGAARHPKGRHRVDPILLAAPDPGRPSALSILKAIQQADLGPWDNAEWVRTRLIANIDALPNLIDAYQTLRRDSMRTANVFLRETHESLRVGGLNLGWDDDALRSWAEGRASRVRAYMAQGPKGIARALTLPLYSQFDLPNLPRRLSPEVEVAATLARLAEPGWWRRRARKASARKIDQIHRDGQQVHRGAQRYCATRTVFRFREQRHRNELMLANLYAVDIETEEHVCLLDASNASVANPANRRRELMTRLRGFEEYGNAKGHAAVFFTLTTPSRFHPRSGKRTNPRYDGTTPKDAQAWLAKRWACARAAMQRADIECFGFRVAEPHHDGTPHWHLILWVDREQRASLETIIRKAWEIEPEPGSAKHRIKIERIDPKKGSATGYVSKYVSKNVDGHALDTDGDGMAAIEAADRTVAWASTWSIRQFQQIGGPSVTVWRELRRFRSPEVWWPPLIVKAWFAADSGDWAAFCAVARPLRPWVGHPFEPATGALLRPPVKPSGEPAAERVLGVQLGDLMVHCHRRMWRIVPGGGIPPPLD